MILAIDFDGTIHNDKAIPPGKRMGPPTEGAKGALDTFREAGDVIIVFCVWATDEANIETISKWMQYFELPFDDITNVKPIADYYIDDKAVKFLDWGQVLSELL